MMLLFSLPGLYGNGKYQKRKYAVTKNIQLQPSLDSLQETGIWALAHLRQCKI
jgi:hypothetical protein